MIAEIKDILIISTPEDIGDYKKLLGYGEALGMNLDYKVQEEPRGLAEAFIIGEEFIGNDDVCLILGDNVFYGNQLSKTLLNIKETINGAVIFGYPVKNPTDFGVVEFDKNNKVLSIEEKPDIPKSHYAIPGLYFYKNSVIEVAKKITPSKRGELEITSINNYYLSKNELDVVLLGRGTAWLDTGSPEGMLKASEFVEAIQSRQGFYISCIEEIAWRKGYISTEKLMNIGESLCMTEYGKYLLSLID